MVGCTDVGCTEVGCTDVGCTDVGCTGVGCTDEMVVATASIGLSEMVERAAPEQWIVNVDVNLVGDWSADDWSEADILDNWRSSAKARS